MFDRVGDVFGRIEFDMHCILVATENRLVYVLTNLGKFQSSGHGRSDEWSGITQVK
jgi:hypothetical protein